MDFKKGTKVEAFVGDDDGKIGFVLHGPDGDGKHAVQVGADEHALAYRETGPDDDKGQTFRNLS